MRVELRTPFVETRPRDTIRVVLAVQNTGDVIDDITVRVVGIDPVHVRSDPERLPLFPGAEGTITLAITVPEAFPAGEHLLPIEVSSTTSPAAVTSVDLRLDVAVDDDVEIAVKPRSLTGGTRGEFEVLCTNRGNRPIDLTLIASDHEFALKHEFEPPFVSLPAGHEVVTLLRVAGRRPLIGANATRRITVTALGPDRQLDTEVTFSQLPRIRRAPVTFLILAGIIGLWALLFTVAINTSLGSDASAKEFPARAMESIAAATGADEPVVGAAAARLDPMATGGGLSGTVVARGTDEAVGRITVEAIRQTRTGPQLMTAAATDEQGAFELVGLVPGTYKLRFTAPGFEDVWFPEAPTEDAAGQVRVHSGDTVDGIDVAIAGLPGGIVGSVDVGEAVANVTVTVTARAVVDGAVGTVVAQGTTDSSNTYSLAPLDTPGTYELTFTAPGYQTATSRERIEGGQIGVANTVRLSAGEGAIRGTVTAGGAPLGGVSIRATSGDQQWTTATPTSGVVGAFELVDLPTPGTYTLTFELDGYGSETIAIALGSPGRDGGRHRHDHRPGHRRRCGTGRRDRHGHRRTGRRVHHHAHRRRRRVLPPGGASHPGPLHHHLQRRRIPITDGQRRSQLAAVGFGGRRLAAAVARVDRRTRGRRRHGAGGQRRRDRGHRRHRGEGQPVGVVATRRVPARRAARRCLVGHLHPARLPVAYRAGRARARGGRHHHGAADPDRASHHRSVSCHAR